MRGWKLDREIDALLRAKRETWDRVTSVTASPEGEPVQSTKDPHKLESYALLEAEIEAKIDALLAVKREILAAVARLPDSRHRALLTERYVNFRTWEQIAVDMHYSWRHMHRVHREALDAMEDVLEKMS